MTTTMPQSGTSPSASPARRNRGPVGAATERHIGRLQSRYRADHPTAVATLARLRRGAGRPVHALPDLWGLLGTEELADLVAEMPPDDRGRFDLDRAEQALHLTVTLWALHQQSHRDADMHTDGRGLGAAVRALMRVKGAGPNGSGETGKADGKDPQTPATDIDEPLRRRFVRVSTATSIDALAQRLREIVVLLRRETLPLDYGLLADQLYHWQWPSGRAEVHRAWGRDFHLAHSRGGGTTGTGKVPAEAGATGSDTAGGLHGTAGAAEPYGHHGPYGPGE